MLCVVCVVTLLRLRQGTGVSTNGWPHKLLLTVQAHRRKAIDTAKLSTEGGQLSEIDIKAGPAALALTTT